MKTLLLLLVLVLMATTAQARIGSYERQTEWGYGDDNGPNTWPNDYSTCGGASQSPVELTTSEADTSFPLKTLLFNGYDDVPESVKLINTGHSVEIRMDVDASVTGGILTGEYTFLQFHFHWGAVDTRGSEHTIDEFRYAGELHLVHYKKIYDSWTEALKHDDGVAVLSVLLELSPTDNPNLQPIVNGLMDIITPEKETCIDPVVLQNLLPNNLDDFFSYQGSLTTPECNEVVTWTVFRDTIPISNNQLTQFRMLMGEDGRSLKDNFRNLQPLNNRKVYRSGSGQNPHGQKPQFIQKIPIWLAPHGQKPVLVYSEDYNMLAPLGQN